MQVPVPACLIQADGRIVAANEHWRAAMGDADRLDSAVPPVIELRVPHAGGERWWRCTLSPLPSGELQVVAQDVSAEKLLTAALLQRDRLLAMGSMTGGIAHELNNPLASLVTNMSFLQQELPSLELDAGRGEDVQGAVEDAAIAVQRLRQLVQGLAALASADPEPQPLDVNAQIEAVVALCHCELRHRAQVVLELEPQLPPVMADAPSLAQVCMTLILHGAHVPSEKQGAMHRLTVRTTACVQGITVEVVASGPGVMPITAVSTPEGWNDELPAISSSPVPTSSLALWIARQRVRELGGSLSVNSHPQRGCEFVLRLPAASTSETVETSSAQPEEAARPKTILLVEDDRLVANSLRRLLTDYEVRVALGGREAARILMHESFDLIVCDLMMPDVTGMDLFEMVEADRPELCERFVFMSGGAFTERGRRFLASHPNPSLTKPFAPDDFLELVRARLFEQR